MSHCPVHGYINGPSGSLAGNSLAVVKQAIYAADAGSAALAASGVGTLVSALLATISGGVHTVFTWANQQIESAIAMMPSKYQAAIANAIAADQWDVFVDAIKDYAGYSGIRHRIANDCGKAVSGAGLPWWLASALEGQIAYNTTQSMSGDAGAWNQWHADIGALFGMSHGDKRILPPAGTGLSVMQYAAKVFALREASGLDTAHPLSFYSADPAQWTTAGEPAASSTESGGGSSLLIVAAAAAAILLLMRRK